MCRNTHNILRSMAKPMVDHSPSRAVYTAVPPAVWGLLAEPVGICVVLHNISGTAINGSSPAVSPTV